MAEAGGYFLSRLKHQTTLLAADTARLHPRDLVAFLSPVESHSTEQAIVLGAQERVASRLVAYRLPEPIVNARRRVANKKAKKKGSTPSKAHRALLAWHLFMTKVPHTIGKTATVGKVYPLRWHSARICQSWKSYLP